MGKDKLFSDKVFYNKLLHLTAPIALQSLMLAAVAAADALMLGKLDQNSMAAVSLATQIQFIQNMIMSAGIMAASILGAQYWGKGDKKTLSDIFCIAIRLCGITSIIFFIGCVFFPRYLMLIFTDEEVLINIGIGYLKLAGWSYLLTGVSQVYQTLMKVTDHAKQSAIVSSSTVVINIILNAIFIFGLLGAPQMGVLGAATATLIARVIEFVWSVGTVYRPGYVKIMLSRILVHNKLLMIDFYKCVGPLLGAGLMWGVGFTSYSAFMGHLGTDATAANSIAAVVRDLVCCFCNGVSAGGSIMIGNELGAGRLDEGKRHGDKLCKLSFIIGFASTAIMLLLTPVIMNFVKLTDGARHLMVGMMVIMAFYMIGRAVNTVVINGIFDAGGDTIFDMYSLAVTMWAIAIPLAVLGTFFLHWPVLVVYACTCLDEVGKIPWVMHHYKKYKWVKDLTRDNL